MKALQITAPGRFEIVEMPTPEPGPGEVLLKVLAVTTCPHWDLHIFGGEPMFPGMRLEYPYTLGQPGHEACGDIASVGPDVRGLEVGRRVCAWRDAGHHRQGCYAQYVVLSAENVIPVPAELPPVECAPLELAMCASAHLLFAEKVEGVAGKRVGVFGLGPAGLVFVQLLRAAGAGEVVGLDPMPERRELARTMGASAVFAPESAELPPRGHPGSFDVVFDCAGNPAAVHRAMELANRLIVLFAVQREPYIFAPQYWGGLTLAGTQPHTREAAEYAVGHLAAGRLDLGALVQRTMTLNEYAEAVQLLKRREAAKVAFLPQETK